MIEPQIFTALKPWEPTVRKYVPKRVFEQPGVPPWAGRCDTKNMNYKYALMSRALPRPAAANNLYRRRLLMVGAPPKPLSGLSSCFVAFFVLDCNWATPRSRTVRFFCVSHCPLYVCLRFFVSVTIIIIVTDYDCVFLAI